MILAQGIPCDHWLVSPTTVAMTDIRCGAHILGKPLMRIPGLPFHRAVGGSGTAGFPKAILVIGASDSGDPRLRHADYQKGESVGPFWLLYVAIGHSVCSCFLRLICYYALVIVMASLMLGRCVLMVNLKSGIDWQGRTAGRG